MTIVFWILVSYGLLFLLLAASGTGARRSASGGESEGQLGTAGSSTETTQTLDLPAKAKLSA